MTYFRVPFGELGTRVAVPVATQIDNTISFEQGYTPQYEEDPATQGTALRIERDKFNGLAHAITSELQQYQQFSIPNFITTSDNNGVAFSYSIGAYVRYDPGTGFRIYRSMVNSNTTLPTVTANWIDVTEAVVSIASGTGINVNTSNGVSTVSLVDPLPAISGENLTDLNPDNILVPAISNYVSGVRTYINENAATTPNFDVGTNLTNLTFETVGPTGSGATNIWTALDDLPSNCRIAIISPQIAITSSTGGSNTTLRVYAKAAGQPGGPSTGQQIAAVGNTMSNINYELLQATGELVPLDSSQTFEVAYSRVNVASLSLFLSLKGFIV